SVSARRGVVGAHECHMEIRAESGRTVLRVLSRTVCDGRWLAARERVDESGGSVQAVGRSGQHLAPRLRSVQDAEVRLSHGERHGGRVQRAFLWIARGVSDDHAELRAGDQAAAEAERSGRAGADGAAAGRVSSRRGAYVSPNTSVKNVGRSSTNASLAPGGVRVNSLSQMSARSSPGRQHSMTRASQSTIQY